MEAGQAQVGARLSALPCAPCGHPPALLASPVMAVKELTSPLLSVNAELLIPTAKPVCQSSHWSWREQEQREQAPVGARTPGARSFLGNSVDAAPASSGCHPPLSFRS